MTEAPAPWFATVSTVGMTREQAAEQAAHELAVHNARAVKARGELTRAAHVNRIGKSVLAVALVAATAVVIPSFAPVALAAGGLGAVAAAARATDAVATRRRRRLKERATRRAQREKAEYERAKAAFFEREERRSALLKRIKGWLGIREREQPWSPWKPMPRCQAWMPRAKRPCVLRKGHRGSHSSVA